MAGILDLLGGAGATDDTSDTSDTLGGLDMSTLGPLLLQSLAEERQAQQQQQIMSVLQYMQQPNHPMGPGGQIASVVAPLVALYGSPAGGAKSQLHTLIQLGQLAKMSQANKLAQAELDTQADIRKQIAGAGGPGGGTTEGGLKLKGATLGKSSSLRYEVPEDPKSIEAQALQSFRAEHGRGPTVDEAAALRKQFAAPSPIDALAGELGATRQFEQEMKQGFRSEVLPDGSIAMHIHPDVKAGAKAWEQRDKLQALKKNITLMQDIVTKDPNVVGIWAKTKNALAGAGFQFDQFTKDAKAIAAMPQFKDTINSKYFKDLWNPDATSYEALQASSAYQVAQALYGQSGQSLSNRDLDYVANRVLGAGWLTDGRQTGVALQVLQNQIDGGIMLADQTLNRVFTPRVVKQSPDGKVQYGPPPAATPAFSLALDPKKMTLDEAITKAHDTLVQHSVDYTVMTPSEQEKYLSDILKSAGFK